ncbi:hypothetical protein Bbelb_259770 [Branchiostoma belcheri]|nr:hypothetical protein Bbelb_259770 [Branchiostoma belcheri]
MSVAMLEAHHVDSATVLATNITNFVRKNVQSAAPEPPSRGKVEQRTSRMYVSTRPEDMWERHYRRRQRQLHQGFFSVAHRPYQDIGDLKLDPRLLVTQALNLPVQAKLPPIRRTAKLDTSSHEGPDGTGARSVGDVPLTPGREKLKTVKDKDVRTPADFYQVREEIRESQNLMRAVAAGKPFKETVQTLQAMRARKGSLMVDPSKRRLSTDDPGADVPVAAGMLSGLPEPTHHDSSVELLRAERNRKALLQKLRDILLVIKCLYNLRSKDLRSKTPLSHEAVKALLKKEVPTDGHGRPMLPLRHVTTPGMLHGHYSPSERSESAETVTLDGQFHSLRRRRISHHGHGHGHGRHTARMARASSTCQRRHERLETWEDLLTVDPGGQKPVIMPNLFSVVTTIHENSENLQSPVGTPGGAHHARSSRRTTHGPGHIGEQDKDKSHCGLAEKLPPWMTVGTLEKTIKTNIAAYNHGKPDCVMTAIKKDFMKVKNKLGIALAEDLDRLNKYKCEVFANKFLCLRLGPLFRENLEEMRWKGVALARSSDTDVLPSKWYASLKTECEDVSVQFDEEFNTVLTRLAMFSLDDATNIPNAVEKLCLLVLSLPADIVSRPSMQEALFFVLERMLDGQGELLAHWFQQRKPSLVFNFGTD